uniref:Uncharacterized protein n=1 Tax=candidate division WOR-3 bacterium TaxID=2052148 RepID=A0A7C4TGR7_UNCW3
MENEQKILIGNEIFTREELHRREQEFRKKRANLSFEQKIKMLIDLQKLARNWGKRKDIIVWKM